MTRVLNDREYEGTSAALVRLAGLVFDASRRAALSAVVMDRVAATGAADVLNYLSLVESSSGGAERQRLLDAVTIQETHFYRNLPQVEALRQEVLPTLIERARKENRPLRIWSAGCSTGEEPYTLAMLIDELTDGMPPIPVHILATDVSESALAVARQGIYAGRTIDLAERGAVERHFDPTADGSFSVGESIRALVEFRLHNLVTDPPPFEATELDLIICRNVTIYFGADTTRTLVSRFHGVLADGGYLLLGHAETLWQVSDAFSLVPVAEAFVYRKEANPVRARHQPPRTARPEVAPSSRMATPKRGVRDVLRGPVRLPRRGTHITQAQPPKLPSPIDDLASARAALAKGRYEEASSLAERATATHPLLVEGYIVQGRAMANMGDDDGAIAALRKAVFLDPRAAHAHFLLATTLSRVGDPGGAALSFASAAETLPGASPETLSELLDGRAVSDLVDLCRQLAAVVSPRDEEAVGVATPTPDRVGWRAL